MIMMGKLTCCYKGENPISLLISRKQLYLQCTSSPLSLVIGRFKKTNQKVDIMAHLRSFDFGSAPQAAQVGAISKDLYCTNHQPLCFNWICKRNQIQSCCDLHDNQNTCCKFREKREGGLSRSNSKRGEWVDKIAAT